ncbi:hypothetical protein H5410_014964, partial [Solanum commersonii]
EVVDLRKDVDYLKSTKFTSLLEAADDLDAPEIPSTTIGDVHRIEVHEERIYGDVLDLEETIVQSVIQTSLTKASIGGSSGAGPSEVTPGTEAQDQSTTLGIDAQVQTDASSTDA